MRLENSLRLVIAILVGSVTACGGGSNSMTVEPTNAAAQAATNGTMPAAGIPVDMTAPDTAAQTPAATDNVTAEIPEQELPDEQTTATPVDLPTETTVTGTDSSAGAATTPAVDVSCGADAALFAQTMLAVTNASRAQARACGATMHDAVPTLVWNDKLVQAAVMHANDMAVNNFFSHDGSNGLGVSNRVEAAQYEWRAVGENIAAGQINVEEVQQGWLESAGHCRNIMNSLFTEVGAACVNSSNTDFGTYWVVVFGDSAN